MRETANANFCKLMRSLVGGLCNRGAKFVQQESDFFEEVIAFSLKPCEECELVELIPSQRSDAVSVQGRQERANEGCFGDPMTSAGLDVLDTPLLYAGGLLLNAKQPGAVSFSLRRRERRWRFH